MSRVELFSERALEAGWLIALALVPIYFDVYSSRVFEPDKTIFFRSLTLFLIAIQVVEWVHRQPGSGGGRSSGRPVEPILRRLGRTNPLIWPVVAVVAVAILTTITSI